MRFKIALLLCLIHSGTLLYGTPVSADPHAVPAEQMAARIDSLFESAWEAKKIAPSPLASDHEFLRRVTLDLIGVIPTAGEARRFLADDSGDKRQRTVDQLLDSPRHSTHLANTFREIILPSNGNNPFNDASGLQRWLRKQFVNEMRYDRIVSEFLAATGTGQEGPAAFYRSLEAKPEKLAAATSRVFLGLQLECAQCHDHPFDDWTQEEFWGYAAFFARIQPPNGMMQNFQLVDSPVGEVTIPETDKVVAPKYPRGPEANEADGGTRRIQLSIWMASRDNPFLAKAAVNRLWSFMFGKGLVNPVDDIGPHNPPAHPQLMNELTDYFIEQDFSLRELFRAIAYSRTYQRSSLIDATDHEMANHDIRLFERMYVKTLSANQQFDSIARALLLNSAGDTTLRRVFISRMQTSTRDRTEYSAGLQQALNLMNGQQISQATSQSESGLLAALSAPFLDVEQRIESAFLASLTRMPTSQEQSVFTSHLATQDSDADRQQALGDIVWALMNSAEFQLNH